VEYLSRIHRHVVHSCLHYFRDIKEESLFAAKLRWSVSSNEVKNMEPFGFRNFQETTFRLETYARMIMDEGSSWIGCRYNLSIIWYPPKGYQSDYEIHKKMEDVSFEDLKGKHRFRRPREETSGKLFSRWRLLNR